MKRLLASIALVALLAIPAYASIVGPISGCTKDGVNALILVAFKDGTKDATIIHVRTVFETVAKKLTYEELSSAVGYEIFIKSLTPADFKDLEEISGPPRQNGICKKA